jgi:hypothetical protein
MSDTDVKTITRGIKGLLYRCKWCHEQIDRSHAKRHRAKYTCMVARTKKELQMAEDEIKRHTQIREEKKALLEKLLANPVKAGRKKKGEKTQNTASKKRKKKASSKQWRQITKTRQQKKQERGRAMQPIPP